MFEPLSALFGRRNHERAGYLLYGQAVAAAREPAYYLALGVPDTLDGRFDLIGLHVFLLLRRLRAAGEAGVALGQAVFDAMFNDMDVNLREMGVGDLSVGKKNRAMWEAFHGRAAAYQQAMDTDDAAGLAAAVGRNVWRGGAPQGAADRLAAAMRRQAEALAAGPDAGVLAGRAGFLPAAEALALPMGLPAP